MLFRILASAAFAITLGLAACDAPEGDGTAPQQQPQQQQPTQQ
jgi:hypothetical protein